jgi:hypothetical protein
MTISAGPWARVRTSYRAACSSVVLSSVGLADRRQDARPEQVVVAATPGAAGMSAVGRLDDAALGNAAGPCGRYPARWPVGHVRV